MILCIFISKCTGGKNKQDIVRLTWGTRFVNELNAFEKEKVKEDPENKVEESIKERITETLAILQETKSQWWLSFAMSMVALLTGIVLFIVYR